MPGSFDQVTLDTLYHGPGTMQTHIRQLPEPANSHQNASSISFLPAAGGSIALVTSDRLTADPTEINKSIQRLYYAPLENTMKYGQIQLLTMDGKPAANGAGCYCSADGLLYFAAKADNDDPNDYDLFSGKPQVIGTRVTITNVLPLRTLNQLSTFESQPTLDPTGKTIYFVSDRVGGEGGTDIWYSERASTSAEWSTPKPLPPPVNSPCDELSPSFSPDGKTVYFSSNGHATVGGYDLFKSHVLPSSGAGAASFSEPENLGIPINTRYDEIFPFALNDTAFFWSSNKPSDTHNRNLYTITHERNPATQEERLKFAQQEERLQIAHMQEDSIIRAKEEEQKRIQEAPVDVYVHVRRDQDHRPADGADLFVRRDSVELYRGVVPPSGNFLIKVKRDNSYDFGAELERTFFDVQHLDLHGYKDTSAEVNLYLPDTLVLRINFPFDDYQHPYEYVIDENGVASTMTWRQALDLTAHSTIRSLANLREMVITGHTDSLGTDSYNERLGFRRATFIAAELEKRGVPKGIMTVRSEGRKQPVSRRPQESDEIFRLRSRRVEFVKVFK